MTSSNAAPQRCRLILIVDCHGVSPQGLDAVLAGGDVACAILCPTQAGEAANTADLRGHVKVLQAHEVAALVAHDTQLCGRSGADGIFLETNPAEIQAAIARFSPQKIVGCGKIRQRHLALEIGELQPDFVFFGKLDGDIKPDPHPKNLELADWWSDLIEIPCVVMGGNRLESVVAGAQSGAEFVALNRAVFDATDPSQAVRQANALLDGHAPVFEESGLQ